MNPLLNHRRVIAVLTVLILWLPLGAGAQTADVPAPRAAAVPPPTDDDLLVVRRLLSENRLTEARRLLGETPESIEARLLLGVIITRQDDLPRAIQVFEELADDEPTIAQPWNNLAVLYAVQGMIDKARQALLRAIDLKPDHANAHRNLGDLYVYLAMEAYTNAFSLEPNNAQLRRKLQLAQQTLAREYEQGQQGKNAALIDTPMAAPVDAASAAASPATDAPADDRPLNMGDACLNIGPVTREKTLDAVKQWLSDKALPVNVKTRRVVSLIFQVYLPPLADQADIDAKMALLREQGLNDIGQIHTGVLRGGISLGVFLTPSDAEKHVRRLHDLGHGEAASREQRPVKTHYRLIVPAEASARFHTEAFNRQFPKLKTKTAACR